MSSLFSVLHVTKIATARKPRQTFRNHPFNYSHRKIVPWHLQNKEAQEQQKLNAMVQEITLDESF
ncbi:MAG TPA: hypothetical protein VFB00_04190 [Terriglobales bacterium]|nr:hypothetical protein [Terriglobales bacterium]